MKCLSFHVGHGRGKKRSFTVTVAPLSFPSTLQLDGRLGGGIVHYSSLQASPVMPPPNSGQNKLVFIEKQIIVLLNKDPQAPETK